MEIDFASLIVPVVRRLRGKENEELSTKEELRWGNKGSLAVKVKEGVWYDHEMEERGGCLDFIRRHNSGDQFEWLRKERLIESDALVAIFDYRNEQNKLLYQVCRTVNKKFWQRQPNGSGWINNIQGIRRVLYRLPELLASTGIVFITEGEKKADALIKLGLCATCNVGGAGKGKWRKEYNECLRGRDVVILPDNDKAGLDHSENIARNLSGIARRVWVLMLPNLKHKGDVINWLEAGGTREQLEQLAEDTAVWEEIQSGNPEDGGNHEQSDYETRDNGIYWKKFTQNGFTWIRLSNFTAAITEDVKLDDDSGKIERHFIIEGSRGRADVPAEKYDGMSWVTREWGSRAVITPGSYHKEHLAVAIKTLGTAVERTVFTHLGWRRIGDQLVYLHGGGAISANGPIGGVEVNLSNTLAQFVLPPVTDLSAAIRSSLALLDVAPAHIVYPLWGAVFRAPLGAFAPVTVTVWLAGPSGVLKTSTALIGQAHFAPAISTRSCANWTSTANANERLAYLAKDALMLVDDFAPRGSPYEVSRMHAIAERLIRAQANQAGRNRMNPDATLKMEMYPRCGLLCTGEDVPRGHSLRARMVVIEVGKDDVNRVKLTTLQHEAEAGLIAQAMAGYIAWLARQDQSTFKSRERELRAETTGSHLRTPENIASLMLGVETGMRFAVESGALSEQAAQAHQVEAWGALTKLAEGQEHFLRSERPADRFKNLLQSVLSSGRAHVTTVEGGEPYYREALGWREVAWKGGGDSGEPPEPVYRGQGRRIGWVDGDYLYLIPDAAYSEVQELARTQSASLEVTQDTLWRRLDEAGLIAQKDTGRLTIKVQTSEGRKRAVSLRLYSVLEIEPLSM
jgi:hypothetical protein